MNVAVLVPVLNRPHRVGPLLESLSRATPEGWAVTFILDEGDVDEAVAVNERMGDYPIDSITLSAVDGQPPNYARKINVAAQARCNDAPLLFMAADDLEFHRGWFETAVARMDDSVQVVGTNDICNERTNGVKGRHSTHTLVRSGYVDEGTIDEPGKLLHEGYLHEFVDDEFVETAIHRGVYVHARAAIVEHLHPMVGKAPRDALYDATHARMRVGRRLYQRRRHLWST